MKLNIHYPVNLIKKQRLKESRERLYKRINISISIVGAVFLIAGFSTFLYTFSDMRGKISDERRVIGEIESIYKQYQETQFIISKSEIELLYNLNRSRIPWTNHLNLIAEHLPNDYWLTQISFRHNQLTLHGYGNISADDKPLLILNSFIMGLYEDTLFSSLIKNINLSSLQKIEIDRSDVILFQITGRAGDKR